MKPTCRISWAGNLLMLLAFENFDKIALSRRVKEIEANLCFCIFGENSKWPPFLGKGIFFFLKIGKSTFLRYPMG